MKLSVTKTAKKPGTVAVASAARKTGTEPRIPSSAPAKKTAAAVKPDARATAKGPAKPAAKKVVAKPAAKALAKPAAKALAKPAAKALAKPAVKALAKPAAKTVAKAPLKARSASPASKTAAPATTRAAPQAAARRTPAIREAAEKISRARAAKPVEKAQVPKMKATPVPQPASAASAKESARPAAKDSASRANTPVVPGVVAELADKMKTTVVSKVSEVMTKTTKSTPAATTDGRILSEEEIRTMSEKDYMNPAQLAFFKARLQQLEKDLLKNAGETTEHLRETVLVPDPADRATIEEEHALELRTRDRERKLLKKVQQSIASIDAGDYGWCEETGEPIGIPRLIARPTATLSLEAQQRRELKQKLYGD